MRSAIRDRHEASVRPDPALHFPAHRQQQAARRASSRIVKVLGGTQSGKSTSAILVLADVVRRRSPINDRLEVDTATGRRERPRDRPLTIWVATPDLTKFRTDWLDPAHGKGLKYFLGDLLPEDGIQENPHIELTLTTGDKIIAKSYDQGFVKFESSVVDLIILDEEPQDERIVNSCLGRLSTTNGTLLLAFTPLYGMTYTHRRWYKPAVEQGRGKKIGDRAWYYEERGADGVGRDVTIVQMGTADNPRSRQYDRELAADPSISEAEKNSRRFGAYGFVEGVFHPEIAGLDLLDPSEEHAVYVVDSLPRIQNWYVIADPNYRYGALFAGLDGDRNVFFLGQHLEEGLPSHVHAQAFERWQREAHGGAVEMYADMGSAGKQATCELNDLGLPFLPVKKGADSVRLSIRILRTWFAYTEGHVHPITGERYTCPKTGKLGAPRAYFYRPGLLESFELDGEEIDGSRLIDQLTTARQDDREGAPPDRVHPTQKHAYDLYACARYLALMASFTPGQPDRRRHATAEDKALASAHPWSTRVPTEEELAGPRPGSALERDVYVPTLGSRGGYSPW